MFHASHKFIDPLSSACSLKNETALRIVDEQMKEFINEEYEKESPNDFIPSEEDSVSSQQTTHCFYLIIHLNLSIHSSQF